MASKRTVRTKGSYKGLKAKKVLELSREAKAETAELLKGIQRGTITRVELNTGLKEVDTRLQRMMHFILRIL